jgi:tetratricopeptide (TPR) repeat protein
MNTFKGEFVWDDKTLFVQNYDRWQWKNIKDLLTRPDNLFGASDNRFYRPLPNLTFLIDRSIWGEKASGYHLFNIIFHILSAIVVFYTAQILLDNRYASLATSLLFAVHPIHTESVAWINGRNNPMAGFFYFLAFYCYIKHRDQRNKGALVVSLVSFTCSLLCKEYAFTFPIIILIFEGSYPRTRMNVRLRLYRAIRQSIPYWLAMMAYLLIRSSLLPELGATPLYIDMLGVRVMTVPKVLLFYLQLLVFPVNLNVFHDLSFVETPWDSEFLLHSIGIFGILFAWVKTRGRWPHAFFSMGWIFATLLPVMNIVPLSNTNTFFAERYLYIPSFGFCLLAGILFRNLLERGDGPTRFRAYLAALLLISVTEGYGFEAAKRNLVWQNELSLWMDTVKKSPESFMVRTNLSLALYRLNRLEEAHDEINEAIRLNPHQDTLHYILGAILYRKALFQDSMNALERALQMNPNHRDASILLHTIRSERSRSQMLPDEKNRIPLDLQREIDRKPEPHH